ncbi:MAG: hypothetical protein IV100_25785, partial [Myxococcales bacterium]|nr:hypothetical protein [Myxococcales bacterium]
MFAMPASRLVRSPICSATSRHSSRAGLGSPGARPRWPAVLVASLLLAGTALANPVIGTTDTRLTTTAGTTQGNSQVMAYNPDLDVYLLVWGTSDNKLQSQLFDHTFATVGPTRLLSNNGSDPDAVYNPFSKEFVVSFTSDPGDGDYEVFGLRLRGDNTFVSTGLQVSDDTPGTGQLDLGGRLAVDHETGNVFFVWLADDASFLQDVKGRVMTSTLTAVNAVTLYRDATVGANTGAGVDAAYSEAQNSFLVVYTSSAATDKAQGVIVKSSDGTKVGANFDIASRAGADRAFVASNPTANEYLVVFSGVAGASEQEVFARRVSSAGAPLGSSDFQVSQTGNAGDITLNALPVGVAWDSVDDEYVVIWQGDHNIDSAVNDEFEIFGQEIDADGSAIGTDFRISYQGTNTAITSGVTFGSIIYDGDRNRFVTSWNGDTDAGAGTDVDVFSKVFTTGTLITCGNGVKNGTEGCDDGGIVPGDGCSPTCNVERGWNCSGASCVCVSGCVTNCSPGSSSFAGPASPLTATSQIGSDSLLALKRTVSSAFTLQQLALRSIDPLGRVKLALYTDSADSPGTLLAQTGEIDVVAGENRADVLTAVQLAPGSYWVAVVAKNIGLTNDAAIAKAASGTVTVKFVASPFTSALPASFGTPTSFSNAELDLLLRGCACTPASGGIPGPGCAGVPCGNGSINGGEACDDGGTTSGDGCSGDCLTIESGYVCNTPGAACTCAVGFYLNGTVCSSCNPACATCNGGAANNCLTCPNERVLQGTSCVETIDMQVVSLAATNAFPGTSSTVTAKVKNLGSSTKSPSVAVTLPPGASFVGAGSSPGITCAPSGADSVCSVTVNNLAPNAEQTLTLIVAVDSGVSAPSLALSGAVTIAGDTVSGNNTIAATLTVPPRADMAAAIDCAASVTTTVTSDCVLTVTNGGPSTAPSVTATATLPATLTYQSATGAGWSCSHASGTVTCTRTTLAVSSSTITIGVRAKAPVGAAVESATVAVSATSTASDPVASNNTATDTLDISASPVISLALSATNTTVTPGNAVTLTVNTSNTGTQDASSVLITVVIAESLIPSGTGWSCSLTTGVYTCTRTIPTVTAGAAPIANTLLLTASDPIKDGVEIVTASVTASHSRSAQEGGNDSDSINFTVDAKPEIIIDSITQPGAAAVPGQSRTYTVNLKNIGKQDGTGVVVTVDIPVNTTFDDPATALNWICAAGKCTYNVPGKINGKNGTASAAINFKFDAFMTAGVTSTTVTANAQDDGSNGPTSVDTEQVTTTISAAPDVRVVIANPGVTPAVGGTFTATVTIDNIGNQEATGVAASVAFDAASNVTPGNPAWTCSPSGGLISCSRAIAVLDLNPVVSTFDVTTTSPYPAGLTDHDIDASATGDGTQGTDPAGNDAASRAVPMTGGPVLALTFTDDGAAASPGQTVVYTAYVQNTGNQHVTLQTFSITVPTGTRLVKLTPGGTCTDGATAGTTCNIGGGALTGQG